jgi:hypothetical protein
LVLTSATRRNIPEDAILLCFCLFVLTILPRAPMRIPYVSQHFHRLPFPLNILFPAPFSVR